MKGLSGPAFRPPIVVFLIIIDFRTTNKNRRYTFRYRHKEIADFYGVVAGLFLFCSFFLRFGQVAFTLATQLRLCPVFTNVSGNIVPVNLEAKHGQQPGKA